MDKKQEILRNNKALFWDVKNLENLDDYAIEERFLIYGNWQNIIDLIEIYSLETFKENYIYLKNKKRCNLPKKTINFFNLLLNV